MKKQFSSIGLAVLLAGAVMTTSGCFALLVGAAAGAGGVAWVKGSLEQNFDKPVADLHKASQRALRDIKCVIRSDEIRRHVARIKFEFDDGEKGSIDIRAFTERSSKLKIRVGILGDETKSHIVLNAVLKHL
ncbi:MAG: DUF3568 family protein [Candidatus Omnitrophica bacterium]|nr:DUF3568 family protein [Candidatus Omnitrophota bacterium]